MASTMSDESLVDATERFTVECTNQTAGSTMKGSTIFQLHNNALPAYLFATRSHYFNANNCGRGCPLMNQLEVSGFHAASDATKWRIADGVFFSHEAKPEDKTKWVFGRDEPLPGGAASFGDEL